MAQNCFYGLTNVGAVISLVFASIANVVFGPVALLWREAFPIDRAAARIAPELPRPEGGTVARSRASAFIARQLERFTTRRRSAPQSTGLASAGLAYG